MTCGQGQLIYNKSNKNDLIHFKVKDNDKGIAFVQMESIPRIAADVAMIHSKIGNHVTVENAHQVKYITSFQSYKTRKYAMI